MAASPTSKKGLVARWRQTIAEFAVENMALEAQLTALAP